MQEGPQALLDGLFELVEAARGLADDLHLQADLDVARRHHGHDGRDEAALLEEVFHAAEQLRRRDELHRQVEVAVVVDGGVAVVVDPVAHLDLGRGHGLVAVVGGAEFFFFFFKYKLFIHSVQRELRTRGAQNRISGSNYGLSSDLPFRDKPH